MGCFCEKIHTLGRAQKYPRQLLYLCPPGTLGPKAQGSYWEALASGTWYNVRTRIPPKNVFLCRIVGQGCSGIMGPFDLSQALARKARGDSAEIKSPDCLGDMGQVFFSARCGVAGQW